MKVVRKLIRTVSPVLIITCLSLCTFTNGESDNIQRERKLVLHSDIDIAQEVMLLKDQVVALESKVTTLETEKIAITSQLQKMEEEHVEFKAQMMHSYGSTYIRWGRNACPSTSELVYKGYTAGKLYQRLGNGADNLCLPFEPTWGKYKDGTETWGRAHIYGSEIDTTDSDHIFDYPVNDEDMPCAVCRTNRSTSLMIPARVNCYQGWTLEYTGYLMTLQDNRNGSFDHLCMDQSPEFVPHGGKSDNEHILYLVEGQCGSLPCPPYVQGRELACVVCSK